MAKYLLLTTFEPGVEDTPMDEWRPEEITAHLDYYRALNAQLAESGELVDVTILTPPDAARIVRSDGTIPVVTDGPFQEFKEWVAGFQVVDVDSEERALEIAALVSAVPGVHFVGLNAPAGTQGAERVSLMEAPRIPVKARQLRGVVLGTGYGASPEWIAEGIRAVLPGLRVVGAGSAPAREDLQVLAAAEGWWVGVRE
jgi:hypothetical protein